MFFKLLIAFIVIPLIELALLIRVGQVIGVFPTVMIVALTGLAGAVMAKMQGLVVVMRIRSAVQTGSPPGNSLLEGLLVLIGGVMFITPGFLTDISGFLLLIPYTRRLAREFLKVKIMDWFYTIS